ncbi:MAG: hypothetical protein ACKN9W_09175, partial [Methylococcus sp.]
FRLLVDAVKDSDASHPKKMPHRAVLSQALESPWRDVAIACAAEFRKIRHLHGGPPGFLRRIGACGQAGGIEISIAVLMSAAGGLQAEGVAAVTFHVALGPQCRATIKLRAERQSG